MEARYHQSKPDGQPRQLCALRVEDGPAAHRGLSLCRPNRPLTNEKWKRGSKAFLQAMKLCREKEWLAIKELEPLDYMSYVAAVFKQVTGHYLRGLSGYTGWMRASGYYHWKVAELNQVDRCPHLRGIPVPKGPIPQPSTGQQPPKPQQTQQSCQSDEPEAQTSAS